MNIWVYERIHKWDKSCISPHISPFSMYYKLTFRKRYRELELNLMNLVDKKLLKLPNFILVQLNVLFYPAFQDWLIFRSFSTPSSIYLVRCKAKMHRKWSSPQHHYLLPEYLAIYYLGDQPFEKCFYCSVHFVATPYIRCCHCLTQRNYT